MENTLKSYIEDDIILFEYYVPKKNCLKVMNLILLDENATNKKELYIPNLYTARFLAMISHYTDNNN